MTSGFKKLAARLLAATCLALPLSGVAQNTVPPPAPATDAPVTTLQIPAPIPPRVTALYAHAAQMCGPITGGAQNPVIEQRIQDFNNVIRQSPTGRDLVNTAAQYDRDPAWICFANVNGLRANYYINKGVLTVGLNKTNAEIVTDAAHELRHLYQEKAGLHKIETRTDQDRIHKELASEADAEATAILVLWELKQAGYAAPWNAHNDPAHYAPRSICYARISDAFRKAVEGGATPAVATQAAFRSWYDDERLVSFYSALALKHISIDPLGVSASFSGNAAASYGSCATPLRKNSEKGYQIPSHYISQKINDVIGHLPSYDINYIQQGGGLKAILQGP